MYLFFLLTHHDNPQRQLRDLYIPPPDDAEDLQHPPRVHPSQSHESRNQRQQRREEQTPGEEAKAKAQERSLVYDLRDCVGRHLRREVPSVRGHLQRRLGGRRRGRRGGVGDVIGEDARGPVGGEEPPAREGRGRRRRGPGGAVEAERRRRGEGDGGGQGRGEGRAECHAGRRTHIGLSLSPTANNNAGGVYDGCGYDLTTRPLALLVG